MKKKGDKNEHRDEPEDLEGIEIDEEETLEKEASTIEILEGKLADFEKELAETQAQTKRYLADYQNLQRHAQEERVSWIKSANKDLLLKLLPVLDTLMLAQKHLNDKGLELSIQQFLDVLEKEGVKKIQTVGEEFNPHTMEGVEIVEGENNKVIEEVRAGYTLYDNVIKPAQVKVGKES